MRVQPIPKKDLNMQVSKSCLIVFGISKVQAKINLDILEHNTQYTTGNADFAGNDELQIY